MKYTIFSLGNPERQKRIDGIREAMSEHDEFFVECVNGKDTEQLARNVAKYGFKHPAGSWRPGEAGLWYSTINAWQWSVDNQETIITFEDDAIPVDTFKGVMADPQFPEDFDIASLYIPMRSPSQQLRFKFGPLFQEHGNICVAYSAQGSAKILQLLRDEGLNWPVDIWIYKMGAAGKLNAYSPAQTSRVIIDHDFSLPTNIHKDKRVPT